MEIEKEELDKLVKKLSNIILIAFWIGLVIGFVIAKVFWS